MYLWIKAFHIITVVTWFAGLFYLPRLFVYHAMIEDDMLGSERFKIMERKLYYGIMTPSVLIMTFLGAWMIYLHGTTWLIETGWIQIKLALVLILLAYHVYLGMVLKHFRDDKNTRSHVYYRWLNEAPVVLLVAIVCLAIVKPF